MQAALGHARGDPLDRIVEVGQVHQEGDGIHVPLGARVADRLIHLDAGAGVVGGQTMLGVAMLARMVEDWGPSVAVWPNTS